jgi:hypothetical protein
MRCRAALFQSDYCVFKVVVYGVEFVEANSLCLVNGQNEDYWKRRCPAWLAVVRACFVVNEGDLQFSFLFVFC